LDFFEREAKIRMPMQASLRNERNKSFWYFCMNGKDWPTKDFNEISGAANPPLDRLCPKCAELDRGKSAKLPMRSCLNA